MDLVKRKLAPPSTVVPKTDKTASTLPVGAPKLHRCRTVGKKVQFWKSSGNLALISTERNCTYTYMTELSLYEVKMTKFVAERLDSWCHHRTALRIAFLGENGH